MTYTKTFVFRKYVLAFPHNNIENLSDSTWSFIDEEDKN